MSPLKKMNNFLEFIRKQEGMSKEEFDTSKYKQILASAIPLFNKFGYKNVSIDKIVDNAGIAKGTFYLYFKNKDDLYLKIIENIFDKGMLSIEELCKGEVTPVERFYRNLMGTLFFIEKSSVLKGIMCGGKEFLSESVSIEYLQNRHKELLINLVYGNNRNNIDENLLLTYDIFSHFFTQILGTKRDFDNEIKGEFFKEWLEGRHIDKFFYEYASRFAKAISIGVFWEEYDGKADFSYKWLIDKVKGTDD